jgi:hypothetical protein
MTDILVVDTRTEYRAWRRVSEHNRTLLDIKAAAEDAAKRCIADGRLPVMVEVTIKVAPVDTVGE